MPDPEKLEMAEVRMIELRAFDRTIHVAVGLFKEQVYAGAGVDGRSAVHNLFFNAFGKPIEEGPAVQWKKFPGE